MLNTNGGASTARYTSGAVKEFTGEAPMMPLDDLSQKLDGMLGHAEKMVTEVAQLADKLFGNPPPAAVGVGTDRPSRGGRIGSLNDQADNLLLRLQWLSDQLARLGPLS